MDSWHRSRPDDEPSTTDWRSGSGTGGGGNELSTSLSGSSLRDKWSRSTSWREEEIGDGPGGRPLHSSSAGGGYKPRMSALSGGGSSGGSSRRSVPSSKEGSAAKEDLPNHAASSEKASEEADPGSKKKSEPVRNATADEKPPKASESESRRPRWRSCTCCNYSRSPSGSRE
ncbi:uncharacterized protein LOC120417742 [Culex pipiens pallens]|uniref:uncharacterized protein LOC120417742 n=1 Tax=Culex pipiens pallens TaxID=42434 RepID=UPI0022AA2A5B|nr:uncharacterized protein LOC120417742 [Culex pipiens pallens]